ncbi:hypothetical protein LP7551_04539 [Roseibium album]|nr:hypothetical protein LP7551_04539 [Roseibium album]
MKKKLSVSHQSTRCRKYILTVSFFTAATNSIAHFRMLGDQVDAHLLEQVQVVQ